MTRSAQVPPIPVGLTLTPRQLDIWNGYSGLDPETVAKYRELWTRQHAMSSKNATSATERTRGGADEPAAPFPQEKSPEEGVLPVSNVQQPPEEGPGKQLQELLASMGLMPNTCRCKERMKDMNIWGLEGCRQDDHRQLIVGWLRQEQQNLGWVQKIKAAALAVATGLAFQLDPLDPSPGLLDEALRREEKRMASTPPATKEAGQP